MKLAKAAALLATGLLLAGGTAACSSSGSGNGDGSPASQAEATPNGVADLKPEQILEKAKAAATSATSVHVNTTSGEPTASSAPQAADLDLTLSDKGAQGSISQSGAGTVEIIATADTVYIKGDDAFNQSYAGDEGAQLLEGKWISIPADQADAQAFAQFTSLKSFFEGLLTPSSEMEKVDPQDIGGTQAVGLKTKAGTLWIATAGEPYPVQIDQEGGSGRVTMTDWNADVTVAAPDPDEVVDLSALQEGVS